MSISLVIYMQKVAAEKFDFASVARPGMASILEKGPIDPMALAKMRPSPASIIAKTQRPEMSEEMQRKRMEMAREQQEKTTKGQSPESLMMTKVLSKLDGFLDTQKRTGA